MNCPHCPDTTLVISERSDIEIDYCPKCRGVWLDRGELDKLIERSLPPAQAASAEHSPLRGARGERYEHERPHNKHEPRYRSRKSWLSEIFD
ncbi:MAG: zf-TFIIB domain-containing protein [Burkholderiaceae bacterium]|jgi:Zn-finger nucleic acid-binding protein|nr:zf-TFIIB domain-containing protein [Burkholderiaceae bacterium]MCO5105212.1 zf-TFIIB domain-containing protein [Burkholderiaceae bacterium]